MGCKNCFGKSTPTQENECNVVNTSQSGRLRAKRRKLDIDDLEELSLKDLNKVANTIKTNSKVYCICFISDSEIAVGLESGNIEVYNIKDNKIQYELNAHQGIVKSILLLESNRLCSASGDNTVKIWRLYERTLEKDLCYHTNWVNCLLHPKNSNLFFSGGADNTIQVVDIDIINTEKKGEIQTNGNVDCLCDLENGQFAANAGDAIKFYGVNDFKELGAIEGSYSPITSLVKIGDFLVSSSVDGKIKWYDNNYQKVGTINDSEEISFMLPVDDTTVIALIKNGIKFVDIKSKKNIKVLSGHSGVVSCAASNSSGLLVTGGEDKTIKFWGP